MPKPKWLSPLERVGHFWMGFGARLVYMDWWLWYREAVAQWPPRTDRLPVVQFQTEAGLVPYCSLDRAADTLKDLHDMIVGATCAEFLRWPLVFLLWRFA